MKGSQGSKTARTRRQPAQDRSRQRVERILDAAAEVFADAGYEATTTEAIAARAETSIGSLYQFFPNKQAMFNALAQQYLDRSRVLFDAMLSSAGEMSWDTLVDQAIDAFDLLQQTQPGFRAVWKNWMLAPDFMVAGAALNKEFAKRVVVFLEERAGPMSRPKRELVATMIVEVISAMLFVSAQTGGEMGRSMVDETKVILKRYLAPLVKKPTLRARKKTP